MTLSLKSANCFCYEIINKRIYKFMWKPVVEWAHRRVTQVDRTTVYSLERDRIQDSVTYDDLKERKTSCTYGSQQSRSVKTKSPAKSWTAQAKVSAVMWWSSKIRIIWYICISMRKKNTTCCQCCSHKSRSALFQNICSKSFEPALNTITWFMLILCWFQLRFVIRHKTSQHRSVHSLRLPSWIL